MQKLPKRSASKVCLDRDRTSYAESSDHSDHDRRLGSRLQVLAVAQPLTQESGLVRSPECSFKVVDI